MGSRGAKDIIANKLGFKNGALKCVEAELEKVKRENSQLRSSLDEMVKRNRPDSPTRGDLGPAAVPEVSTCEIGVVQEQLRDALEKNQQWLVYDQQREVYVQGILSRMAELEQQLNHAKTKIQGSEREANSEDQLLPSTGHNQEQVLYKVQQELKEKQEQVGWLQAELEKLRVHCEDRRLEEAQVQEELHEKQRSTKQLAERTMGTKDICRLQNKLKVANASLEEERKRAADLLLQVNLLQNSLLKHQEEQRSIAVLKQQVEMSAKEFENEKLDRQSLQHQLHKVLKELRKARDQITRLESAKLQKEAYFSGSSFYNIPDSQDCILSEKSPTKSYNALDESYLECPNCRISYPTSQHRELLMHLDFCFN